MYIDEKWMYVPVLATFMPSSQFSHRHSGRDAQHLPSVNEYVPIPGKRRGRGRFFRDVTGFLKCPL